MHGKFNEPTSEASLLQPILTPRSLLLLPGASFPDSHDMTGAFDIKNEFLSRVVLLNYNVILDAIRLTLFIII